MMSKQRVSISLKEILKIIEDHEKRMLSVGDISKTTGKPASTIYIIFKVDSLHETWETGERSSKVKSIAHSKWPQLDEALVQ